MAKTINEINFTNLSRIGKGTAIGNVRNPDITSESDLQDYIDAGEEYRNIQSVLIDWNGATGIFGFTEEEPLQTTGQLLHALNTTCASKPNLIKVNGNIYETKIDDPSSDELSYIEEPYIGEPYIELPNYPNWYSLSGKPKTFRPTIGTTSITAAAGNHTHQTSIVASTGTGAFAFAFGSTYTLNAGGTSFEFTMPNVPTIPTKVSQLTNDKGYLTAHPAKGNASVTLGGDNTFIREIQFDDNGHFVSAYLMTIDELKELLGIGSEVEPVNDNMWFKGDTDPATLNIGQTKTDWDTWTMATSILNTEVYLSDDDLNDHTWYFAFPQSWNVTTMLSIDNSTPVPSTQYTVTNNVNIGGSPFTVFKMNSKSPAIDGYFR